MLEIREEDVDNSLQYKFLDKITAMPFVEQIWLFGSRARGDNQERSDIDIAIICPTASDDDWAQILDIVDNADTLLKIDCIRFDILDAKDKIKENILQFKKVIYKKEQKAMQTIFWQDYFVSLGRAIDRLGDVIRHQDIEKNDYMQDAAIQRFEFVIELFWKVLKKVLAYEKIEVTTPRDVMKKAFQFKLIGDEEMWLKMLDDRNNTSHVYKQEDAKKVFDNIKTYLPILENTYAALKRLYKL